MQAINRYRRVSPSVYIVFTEIKAVKANTPFGKSYMSVTLSFAPHELSTIEGTAGATKSFNFGDLPCPPPDVASADWWFYNPSYNPTRTYQPRILPPTQIYNVDPSFSTCTFAATYQGFDPNNAVTAIHGPIDNRHHHHRYDGPPIHRRNKKAGEQSPVLDRRSQPTPIPSPINSNIPRDKRYQRAATPGNMVQAPMITAPPMNK